MAAVTQPASSLSRALQGLPEAAPGAAPSTPTSPLASLHSGARDLPEGAASPGIADVILVVGAEELLGWALVCDPRLLDDSCSSCSDGDDCCGSAFWERQALKCGDPFAGAEDAAPGEHLPAEELLAIEWRDGVDAATLRVRARAAAEAAEAKAEASARRILRLAAAGDAPVPKRRRLA